MLGSTSCKIMRLYIAAATPSLWWRHLQEEDEDSPTITSIQSPEPPAGDPDLPDPVGPPTEGIATDAPSTRRLLEVGWNLVVPAEYRATRG